MRATALLASVVTVATALVHVPAAPAGSDQPASRHCVGAEEAMARQAGSDEDGPPKFSGWFYKHSIVLDASLDGVNGKELPVSIEEVCGIPRKRAKQAAQLAGTDGIALLLGKTTIWQDGKRLRGEAASTALDGADTASLRVRLTRTRSWHKDEDGNPVPTFRTRRIRITD